HDAGNETLVVPGREPFKLEPGSALLFYLERLRDEAHRFAITAHRRKREKELGHSALDDIEGIGSSKKKALLNYFGSVKNIVNASVEELKKAEGISLGLAQKIYEALH
ncbi:MAG: excinuclease ABC subunit C, partial [Rickettsiales bacterium]|nr:excinuclease ABC subunit C [Rickettsiales bacterium]